MQRRVLLLESCSSLVHFLVLAAFLLFARTILVSSNIFSDLIYGRVTDLFSGRWSRHFRVDRKLQANTSKMKGTSLSLTNRIEINLSQDHEIIISHTLS